MTCPDHHPIVGVTAPSVDKVCQGIGWQSRTAAAADRSVFREPARAVRPSAGKSRLSDDVGANAFDSANWKSCSSKHLRETWHGGRISGLVIQALRYLGKIHVKRRTRLKASRPQVVVG